jgi:chromosome segregation ATPase
MNVITSSALMEFENLRSRLEGQIQANIKLHSYTEDLQKNVEMAYRRPTLEIQNLQARSSHSDQTVYTGKTNLSALKNEIRKANRNIMALQKRAHDAESRAAGAAFLNTKWSDNTLVTIKAIFDNFMSDVLGKMESAFDKRTIRKMATSVAKSIAILDYKFNKGTQDIPLPLD